MDYLYCKNSDCGVYLGSLGGSSCLLCGWQAPTECNCDESSDHTQKLFMVLQQRTPDALHRHTFDDLLEELAEMLDEREAQPAVVQQEPVPWEDIVSAVKTVVAEASRRGEMFPQESDKQAEDRAASRRVCELIKWYATCGGSVAEKLEGWPKRYAQPAQAVVQQLIKALENCCKLSADEFTEIASVNLLQSKLQKVQMVAKAALKAAKGE